MIFATLTLSPMGHALAVRSRESLFKVGMLSNKALLGAVLLAFIVQMAVIYVQFLQNLFKTNALSTGELLLSLVVGKVVFWGVELEKWLMRRGEVVS